MVSFIFSIFLFRISLMYVFLIYLINCVALTIGSIYLLRCKAKAVSLSKTNIFFLPYFLINALIISTMPFPCKSASILRYLSKFS
uniref:Uncharacterized protein n=1 Tax=Iridovirus sp. TaxID=135728 RepID=A0AAU7YB73_9VIRU